MTTPVSSDDTPSPRVRLGRNEIRSQSPPLPAESMSPTVAMRTPFSSPKRPSVPSERFLDSIGYSTSRPSLDHPAVFRTPHFAAQTSPDDDNNDVLTGSEGQQSVFPRINGETGGEAGEAAEEENKTGSVPRAASPSQQPSPLSASLSTSRGGTKFQFISQGPGISIVERRPYLEWLLGRKESTVHGAVVGGVGRMAENLDMMSPRSAPTRTGRWGQEGDGSDDEGGKDATGRPLSARRGSDPPSPINQTYYYTQEIERKYGSFLRSRDLASQAGISWHKREEETSSRQVPRLIQRSKTLTRAYMVNEEFKSLFIKSAINIYLFVFAWLLFRTCVPWYTYFKYLTAWGWTLVQIYWLYTLYLDVMARVMGSPEKLSFVALTTAQALSELATAVQVVVVMFFWIIVYPQESWRHISWEINMHGVGLVLMLMDYVYRFTGFSLRNHNYILGFAAFYSVLHITTVLYTGEEIYPGMDFRSFCSVATFLAGLSTVVFTHKFIWLWHHWGQFKEGIKTSLGIACFFLLPRQNSADFIIVREFPPDQTSKTPVGEQPKPDDFGARLSLRRARTMEFPHLGRRLSEFVSQELLSVSPTAGSITDRSHNRTTDHID